MLNIDGGGLESNEPPQIESVSMLIISDTETKILLNISYISD